MIKVRGFQIAPAEIETVLHGHPAVRDCAVFGVPDGANGEAVVAAVAIHSPVDPEVAAELTARVDAKLASYKRLSRVVFVPDIPRLPSGKVLRRVLKESYGCTSDS
jgi:acyl-coenzyme A synthetase/AMP-(fatty) acid ligase